MIYNFPVPIILDKTDFFELLTSPLDNQTAANLAIINETRKKFSDLLTQIYPIQQTSDENFSKYKESFEAYLSQSVDLVSYLQEIL